MTAVVFRFQNSGEGELSGRVNLQRRKGSWKGREFEFHPMGLPEVGAVSRANTGEQIKARHVFRPWVDSGFNLITLAVLWPE